MARRKHGKHATRPTARRGNAHAKTMNGYCPNCGSTELGVDYKVAEGDISAKANCKKCGHIWSV